MFLFETTRHKVSLFTLLSVSLLLACFAFLTTSITPAHAVTTVPTTMNFQGRLADSSGNIMPDGLYNMQFRLFTVGSGGSSVWNETRENNGTDYRVQVTNGLFSTKLGQVSPLSASLFASGSLYFEITMATPATATCSTASCASWETPMTPRHELSTSAYAYNAETLDGLDSAAFAQISSNNTLTGTNTISTTNVSAFQVQNASTVSALTADTSNLRVQVGSSTTDATAVFFLLDQYNQATDPTNTINGAMYYNTSSNKFRCYQNSAWTDCIGAGAGGGATTALDNLASTNINAALNATSNNLTLQTTTSGDVNIAPAGVINLQGDAVLASGNTLRIVGDTYTNIDGYPSPTEGQITYDQTNDQLLIYNATLSKWVADKSDAILVAASNSSQADKNAADYVADGEDSVGSGIGTLDGDQIEINQALTAGAGRKVVLLAGTYTIDASISVPNNTTLAGVGTGTLIQLGNFGATSTNLYAIENSNVTTGTNIIIRDLRLDGRSSINTAGSHYGMWLEEMGDSATSRNGARIENVNVENFKTTGIEILASDLNKLTNVYIYNNGSEGVFFDGSTNNLITDSNILNNGFGVYSYGAHNTISNNHIRYNDVGINVGSLNTVIGNLLSANITYGVYIDYSTYSTVSNNIIRDTGGSGLYISGAANNIINNNSLYNNGGATDNNAIFLNAADSNTITGNSITDPSATTTNYAINISNSTSDLNYLADNRFSSTPGTSTIRDLGTGTIYSNQPLAENGGSITTRTANSTTAFQVQNAAGLNILTADTDNGEIEIGSASLAGKLAISDGSSNTATITVEALAGDYTVAIPTITGNDTFCLESLGNCSGGSGATTALDNLVSTNINAALNATSNNLTLQTTTSGDVNIAPAGVINLQGDAVLASGNTLRIVGDTYTNIEGYSSPTEGQITYDQTNDQLLVYNATLGKWQADKSDAILVAASNSSQADKNAADYVADGTDDQVQINDALDDADPAGTGRKTGKVYLFAGTYTTHRTASSDATIFIPNNTTLAGAGRGTLIQLGDIDTTDNLIENSDTTTGTGVVIQDLRLDGQKTANTAGTQHGIYFNGMGDSTSSRQGGKIMNIWANNFRSSGISLYASYNNTLTGNTAQGNNSSGIYLLSSSNNTLIGNTAQNNSLYGIYLNSGSNNNTLTGNTARSNSWYGIYLSSSSDYNIIIGNYLQSSGNYGIYLNFSSNNTLTGNTVQLNGVSGIYVGTSSNNTITGNKLNDNGGSANNDGIYLSASDSNTITGNSITDTSATTTNYAINISNSTSDLNYLADNRFSSTPGTSTINDAGTGTVYSNQPLAENGGNITTRSSGGLTLQTTTGNISLQPAGAFEVQNASSNVLLGVDTSVNKVLFGTAGSVGGALQINAATSGNVTISIPATTTSYNLILPSAAGSAGQCLLNSSTPGTLTWGSCGGAGGGETKTVSLIPEFAGGTLQADGSNNAGIMNADFVSGLSAGEGYKHSYYQWTTSNTSAQDYNIIVNTQLPSDYASGLGNLKIWGYSSSTTLATATIQFADVDGTTCYASPVSFTPSTASTWEQKTVGTMSGCSFSANDIVTVTIVVAAEDDEVVRVGELSFEYTN